MSSVLEARGVTVLYGEKQVLDIPSVQVKSNRVLAIIGPNGSGKTTLLLCLSLLLKPTSGTILYKGKPVVNSLVHARRRFAVVFQESLLLNSSVVDNVTLGMKLRGFKKDLMKERSEKWLDRFGISHLAERQARTLSGGEAQRASLARAFALQPEVLFLDEPFSALDVPTRQSLFGDMINILHETKITTVMVTHDRNEAQSLADDIIVLFAGKIAQEGSPSDIFSRPASEEIARFVGMENIIEGDLISSRDCLADVKVQNAVIQGISTCLPGEKVYVCIRPEDIIVSRPTSPVNAVNTVPGRVISLLPFGPLFRVNLDCGYPITALITRLSSDEMALGPGVNVLVSFRTAAIHIIPLAQ